MIKILDGYELKECLISVFEEKFDIKLPSDYKEFMRKNNGGEPEEECLFDFFDNVVEKSNTSVIRSFLEYMRLKKIKYMMTWRKYVK